MTLRLLNNHAILKFVIMECENTSFTSLLNYLMLNSFCLDQNVTIDLNICILLNSQT